MKSEPAPGFGARAAMFTRNIYRAGNLHYDGILRAFSDQLGVRFTGERCEQFGIGFCPIIPGWADPNGYGYLTWAEKNAAGETVGIGVRTRDGQKLMHPGGSKRGLIYSRDLRLIPAESAPQRTGWERATSARPCPICGKTKWCGTTGDGEIVHCMNEPTGAFKQAEDGGWLHRLKSRSTSLGGANAILIVEGLTDLLASEDLRFDAIGRPSNAGGIEEAVKLLKHCMRPIIVLGEQDRKLNGQWPGQDGMERTARALAVECSDVRMLMPPEGIKDLRAWVATHKLTRPEFIAYMEKYAKSVEQRSTSEPILTCLADVQPRKVSWLWQGRIPLGRLSLLIGRPGEGKSFLTTDMAARVSTGTSWPDGSECPAGSVIFISAEDDPADTIRPRLDAHHADVSHVHLLSMTKRIGKSGKIEQVMFTLADVAALEAALHSVPDCRLVIVDPIGSFIGGNTDTHKDNAVRAVLAPVAKLAERYGAAVLVVAHRRKGEGSHADDLALGSRAFTGIARATWHLSRDKDNKARRLLLPGKNNLGPEGTGLAFSIGGIPPRVLWEKRPVEMTADDGLAAENGEQDKPGPAPQARNAATDWLRTMLANGPVGAGRVKDEAVAAGFAWRTVQRAAEQLQVVRKHDSTLNGGWEWSLSLPSEDAKSSRQ